ncbi:unnamed protein product [Chrysodeixis includens]|uniref:Uncharacterized protein n=1 Tax=Chrysodeixis includens TaxID=689277 RepID=A0A9P0C443_CHRIL|nr:unnamed protein product [Chrysodeixis includens]
MGTQVWWLVASIFLVLVKTEAREVVTESFYERQFSSPAPLPQPSTAPDTTGLKEVVLFLTPEQVQTLQAAGALVRPFPELLSGYPKIQDQNQRNINLNLKIQNASVLSTDAPKTKTSNPGLDTYYMLFNIQEINDDLALMPPTVEVKPKIQTTTPRYKYTKSRNRNKDKEYYAASNAKKSNRTKTISQNSNSEYVRFLPNYEKDDNDLKMLPYNALPIIPYHGNSNPTKALFQSNSRGRTNGRNSGQSIATERNLTFKPPVVSTQTVKNEVTKSIPLVKATSAPLLLRTPGGLQRQPSSRPSEFKESLITIDNLPPVKKQQIKIETSVQAPVTVQKIHPNQDQLSRLLAPLYQHQVITEAVSQKEISFSEEGKVTAKPSPFYQYKDVTEAITPQKEKPFVEWRKITTKLPPVYQFSTETISLEKDKLFNDEGKVKTKSPPIYQYQTLTETTSQRKEKPLSEDRKVTSKRPPVYEYSFGMESISQQKDKILNDEGTVKTKVLPFYQYQDITLDTRLSQQKEKTNEEVKSKAKIQRVTDAPQTLLGDLKLTTEVVKPSTYLGKSNPLSEVENISLPPMELMKIPKTEASRNPKNQDIRDPIPIQISKPAVSIPTSVLVRSEPFDLPSLYPVTLDITRSVSMQQPQQVSRPLSLELTRGIPIPIPVSKPFKVEMRNVVPVPVGQRVPPIVRNVFVKEQAPILMTQAIPLALKHEVPRTVPIEVEKQIIIRPIWDH